MLDREAIRDLPQRYCHYVWQQDVPAVVSLFTPDGEFDAGGAQPTAKGSEALLAAYTQGLAALDPRPFIHNHVIDLEGDRATGTCYLELRATQDGQSVIAAGHYDDVYAQNRRSLEVPLTKIQRLLFCAAQRRLGQVETGSGTTGQPAHTPCLEGKIRVECGPFTALPSL